MNPGLLTTLLNDFANTATMGYTHLLPDAFYLLRWFITLEIVLFGIAYALGKEGITSAAIRKMTFIFFFVWVLNNAQELSRVIVHSFGRAGMVAGGHAAPANIIFDPSRIIDFGFIAVEPVFRNSSVIHRILNPIDAIAMGWISIFILLAFFFIGVNMFLTILEFYIFTVCSVILLPFILFKPTRFLAEKAISGAFAIGIRVMVLSFVIGLSYGTLQSLVLPEDPTLHQLFLMFLASGSIAFLSWHAPSLAMGLVAGSPNMSGMHAGGFAAATGYGLGRIAGHTGQLGHSASQQLAHYRETYRKFVAMANEPTLQFPRVTFNDPPPESSNDGKSA